MAVTSPITNFENMKTVLKILYDNNSFEKDHSLDKEFIANKMKKSTAIVNNALPMLRDISLVSGGHRYKDKKVFLLKKGKIFYEKLKINNHKEIREYSLKLIKESDSQLYKESYKLLKREPQIPYYKLGEIIRKKIEFNKIPKSSTTYINIGRTIKDIFCGLQIIDMDKARVRRRNIRGRTTSKLYADISITQILNTIEKFDINNNWQMTTPSHFSLDREKELETARTLVDLNIAEYHDYENRIIKLTDQGERLKKNLKVDSRKEILMSILLAHDPVKHIVTDLIDLNKEFASIDVGGLISDYNKSDWAPLTKIHRGHSLITWLKEAEIVVDSEKQFRYKISKNFNIRNFGRSTEIDWSVIDDKQFEDLCCELLESLNQFENVTKMGGAPGDLKRDISAIERIDTAFGTERRKWLVQCKHYTRSKVHPDDLPGLANAISTHDADGLLVITSNELTPNARIYLEKFNDDKKIPYVAKWIEKNKLEDMIKSNQTIFRKYFQINDILNH